MKPMSTNTKATSFSPPSYGMGEAMKAGIGATACSVLLLTIVFVAMHLLPLSGG
jgi:hypothetical protein